MTVNKLHKALGRLIADGMGRFPVAIDKTTFTHPLEPDAVVLDVDAIFVRHVSMLDDDGFQKCTKRGAECFSRMAVLSGASGQKCCGHKFEACRCREVTT